MGDKSTLVVARAAELWQRSTRRDFLRLLGVGGTVVLLPSVFAACGDNTVAGPGLQSASLDLSTDTGILNYAYALEQLEAAFYTSAVGASAFGSLTAEQQEVLTDLRNHEVIHREFFRAALGAKAIGVIGLDSSTVASSLASAAKIFQTAELLEDTGVAAYNGAGKYLSNPDYLTIAGKIVSVEARHAAAVRDIRESLGVAGSPAGARFADDTVVQPSGSAYQGLDVKLEPSVVLSHVAATGFVTTSLSIGTPPATKSGTPDAFPT